MANRNAIYIWDPQYKVLPQNYQQALEMAEKYATVLEEPSDRLKRFAQDMAKYAASHQDELEEEVFDFLDSMPYAVNEQTTIALEMELPDDDWEQALEITAEKATAKGLIVVASEVICAFLPHGKTLPPKHIREWITSRLDSQADSDTNNTEVDTVTLDNSPQNFTPEITEKNLPKTLKQYKKWADIIFDKELSVLGFKLIEKPEWSNNDNVDSVFMRPVEIGQQYIFFSYAGRNPYFGQNIAFSMVSSLGEEIYRLFPFFEQDVNTVFRITLNNIYDFTKYQESKIGVSEVKRQVKIIKDLMLRSSDMNLLNCCHENRHT